jgi:hypothetical protein
MKEIHMEGAELLHTERQTDLAFRIWHSEDRASWCILIIKPMIRTISGIYLIKYSTCFGQAPSPPSGVCQHCIHAVGICHSSYVDCLLAWSSWRTGDLSETCRVLYQINLRNSASSWFTLYEDRRTYGLLSLVRVP